MQMFRRPRLILGNLSLAASPRAGNDRIYVMCQQVERPLTARSYRGKETSGWGGKVSGSAVGIGGGISKWMSVQPKGWLVGQLAKLELNGT